MEQFIFVKFLSILFPILAGSIGGFIILLNNLYYPDRDYRELKKAGIFYLFTSSFNWVNLLLFYYFPELLWVTNTLWGFSMFINPIFLYRMIDISVSEAGKKKRSRLYLYYIIPILKGCFLLLLLLIRSYKNFPATDTSFSFLLSDRFIITDISLFGSFYILCGLTAIYYFYNRPNKEKNRLFDHQRIILLTLICTLLIIMSPIWFFDTPENSIYISITSFLICTLGLFHIMLVGNIIIRSKENHHQPMLLKNQKS